MHITLCDGTDFEIRSMTRQDARETLKAERDAAGDSVVLADHADRMMAGVYGKEELDRLQGSNRDFMAAYRATLAYSFGHTEEARKNSSTSGGGPRTRTE